MGKSETVPMPDPSQPPISGRELKFVEHYLADPNLNIFEAYRQAGFEGKVLRQAWKIFRRPGVQAAIRRGMAQRIERVGVTQDRVVQELARIAFADMRNYVEWSGDAPLRFLSSQKLTADAAGAVSEIEESEMRGKRSRKIKLHDKVKALELLGKHLGMFAEKKDVPSVQVTQINLGESERKDRAAEIMSVLAQAGMLPAGMPDAIGGVIDVDAVSTSGGSASGSARLGPVPHPFRAAGRTGPDSEGSPEY